jgi:hypothetical protein
MSIGLNEHVFGLRLLIAHLEEIHGSEFDHVEV